MQRKLAGVWGGGIAPPQKFFSILSLKMATFSAFWALAHAARGGHGPFSSRFIDSRLKAQ